MRRLFWVAVGATAGVYAARRVSRATRSLSPDSAAIRVGGAIGDLASAVREFSADVRTAMAAREEELSRDLGLADVVDVPPRRAVPAHAAIHARGPR